LEPTPELVGFCRREHPRLVGMLSLYCGDSDVAEELAQETIACICRDWNKVRRLDAPGAWVHRVAINLANSYYRRKSAERRAKQRLHARIEPMHHDPDGASKVAVRKAVAELPRRQRTALVLRYYLDLSVRESAEMMGCPEGTVKTLTHKAIASLRRDADLVDLKEVVDVA
jgi:RNA polymerase sigma factor (sigma-70 family)